MSVLVAFIVFAAFKVRKGENPLDSVKSVAAKIPNPIKNLKKTKASGATNESVAYNDFDNPNYSDPTGRSTVPVSEIMQGNGAKA